MENKKYPLLNLIIFILVILKFILTSLPGEWYDLSTHQKWGEDILKYGILSIYNYEHETRPSIPNLPPLFIYILGLTAFIYRLISGSLITAQWALKIPAVISDILTAYLIFYYLKEKISLRNTLLITIIYLIHPFILYNSSIWGQWDSIYTLPVIFSLILLEKKQISLAIFFASLASLVKFQAIIFLPLILFFIYKNYKIKKLILSLLIFLTTIILICSPLFLAGVKPIDLFRKTWLASTQLMPYLSVNTFNLWWILQILNMGFIEDTLTFIGPINFENVGLILFALTYLLSILYLKQQKYNFNSFALALAFISFSFFFLPTEIHERYIFPFFAISCLILSLKKNLFLPFVILSITATFNLFAVFPLPIFSLSIINLIKETAISLSILFSLINLTIFIYFIIYLIYDKSSNCSANL